MVPKRDGGCRLGGTQATVRGRPDEQRDGILGDGAVGEAELDDVSNGVGVAGVAGVEGGSAGLVRIVPLGIIGFLKLVGASGAEALFLFLVELCRG